MNPYMVTIAAILFGVIAVLSFGSISGRNDGIQNPASSIESVQDIVNTDVEAEPEPEAREEIKSEEPKEEPKVEKKKDPALTAEQEIERDNRQMELYNELELKAEAVKIQTEIYNAKIDILNERIKVREADGESYEDLEQEKLELFYALKNGTLE